MLAIHSVWIKTVSFPGKREIPAGFQYNAVASLATATNALPMPTALDPTSISRNGAEVVPTFETSIFNWLRRLFGIVSVESRRRRESRR
jgi:hypothetical protein